MADLRMVRSTSLSTARVRGAAAWLALTLATLAHAQTGGADPFRGVVDAHIAKLREDTLARCKEKGIALPNDFVAWVDSDPIVRTTVYGCRKDPLPVLLMLRSLEIDLGEQVVRKDYTQLALAFAIQDSYAARAEKGTGWNDGDGATPNDRLPDVTPRPRLQLTIPGDPRVRVDCKDASRTLDVHDHLINFLEDHAPIEVDEKSQELPPLEYDDKGVAKPRGKAVTVVKKKTRQLVAADVIASRALQQECNDYMKAHGHPEVVLDCGDRAVHWASTEAIDDKDLRARIKAAHDLFHDSYRNKGRMPNERDAAPTAAQSMAWFLRNDAHRFDEKTKKERQWPRFPLNAPWPVLLMLAADDQPLREREDIWIRFRDEGEFRTYGEYIGGIAQQFDMQSARRTAPIAFNYGSIQMMWKDGGVCGTMGNIGARTYRIVGVPSSTAGQPGHCAIVLMDYDEKTKRYSCKGGQYATGGDEVTTVHAGFHYDDRGGRKPMVFHQSVAMGVNHDFAAYVRAHALLRAFDAMDQEAKKGAAVALVAHGMKDNPFAIALVNVAIEHAHDRATALAVQDAFVAVTKQVAADPANALYLATVRDLAHARIEQLPLPTEKSECAALLRELERQGCERASLLGKCWRAMDGEDGFLARTQQEARAYVASEERSKSKRTSQRFAARVQDWAKAIGGKERTRMWAESMLEAFAGNEAIERRGKKSVDPAVEALCKLAGKPAPKL
jgi:hypothetical protein